MGFQWNLSSEVGSSRSTRDERGDEEMIIRLIAYHARPGTDVVAWAREHAAEMRGVPGMRKVEFFHSVDDPSQWGATMHFRTSEDLKTYKATGAYKGLVESLTKAFLDRTKPVHEQLFEVIDA